MCTPTLAGVDFGGDNITFTISPGDSGFVVQFRVFDDQIQENSENFIGLLHFSGNSTGAVIGRNAIRLIIEDNDCKLVKPQKPTMRGVMTLFMIKYLSLPRSRGRQ